MARLPQVADADADAETSALFADIQQRRGAVSAFSRTLASAPGALRAYEAMSAHVRTQTPLEPRLRELVVLRIAQHIGNEFEWRRHVPAALACGATRAAIERLDAPQEGIHTARERAALRLVDEHLADGAVSDECMGAVRACFTDAEAVELCLLAGFYLLNGMLVLAFDLAAGDTAPAADVPFVRSSVR